MRCHNNTLVEYIYQIVSQEIHQELWFAPSTANYCWSFAHGDQRLQTLQLMETDLHISCITEQKSFIGLHFIELTVSPCKSYRLTLTLEESLLYVLMHVCVYAHIVFKKLQAPPNWHENPRHLHVFIVNVKCLPALPCCSTLYMSFLSCHSTCVPCRTPVRAYISLTESIGNSWEVIKIQH
jgi:hypothetical protein